MKILQQDSVSPPILNEIGFYNDTKNLCEGLRNFPLLSIEIQGWVFPPSKENAKDDRKECNVIFNGMFHFTSNNILLEPIIQNVSYQRMNYLIRCSNHTSEGPIHNTSQQSQTKNVAHLSWGWGEILFSLQLFSEPMH